MPAIPPIAGLFYLITKTSYLIMLLLKFVLLSVKKTKALQFIKIDKLNLKKRVGKCNYLPLALVSMSLFTDYMVMMWKTVS